MNIYFKNINSFAIKLGLLRIYYHIFEKKNNLNFGTKVKNGLSSQEK